ncbi:helix-turn-helix domain-containing protein [Bradyrhizobium diazoefficiens]|uniref:helix-turn-helix transcriptional regulator n=1 Tax=Bradyrhizobium diazoefficiens TaxID=1355477 RepID=UPI00190BC17A|nr:helix-turn-helix domain-containing protein [Bradyrhizobium diazoefficiens]
MKVHQEQCRRLRAIEAAKYLCVSRSTLAKWRMTGIGPPHHHCGPRLVYYYLHEIEAWLAACDAAANGQP